MLESIGQSGISSRKGQNQLQGAAQADVRWIQSVPTEEITVLCRHALTWREVRSPQGAWCYFNKNNRGDSSCWVMQSCLHALQSTRQSRIQQRHHKLKCHCMYLLIMNFCTSSWGVNWWPLTLPPDVGDEKEVQVAERAKRAKATCITWVLPPQGSLNDVICMHRWVQYYGKKNWTLRKCLFTSLQAPTPNF